MLAVGYVGIVMAFEGWATGWAVGVVGRMTEFNPAVEYWAKMVVKSRAKMKTFFYISTNIMKMDLEFEHLYVNSLVFIGWCSYIQPIGFLFTNQSLCIVLSITHVLFFYFSVF